MDRRTFVKGTFLGGAGLLLHGFAVRAQSDASAPALPPIETHGLPQVKPSPLGMPGLFPGRVVEVSNANAIARNRVAQPEIKVMIERGMKELTSESSLPAAWARFIGPAGYDMNVYCQANFFGEWETRSYMASIVAHGVTKIINVPTMKDHSASGVTGCLKNLGYGTFNNVARSHRPPYSFTDPLIAVMCSVEPLRSKAVLNIMDGMRQVWHGGPLTQVQDFIYPAGTLYLGTDPVAIDTVELEAIEQKRQKEGAPSVWEHDPASITSNYQEFFHNPSKNLFYRRPGHIAAAGKLGLGIADLKQIDHRRIA